LEARVNTVAQQKVFMFGFFKKRAPAAAPPPHAVPQMPPVTPSQEPSSSISSTDVRVELVRAVLKDTMRDHGLPSDWLRCEVQALPGNKGNNNGPLHIRIIMSKWSGTLLKYTMALERLILTGLDRYDPAVDHSGYSVSWQFSKECACPFPTMPAPETWNKKKASPPKIAEAGEFFDRRHQARQSGSITDRAPKAPPLDPHHDNPGYADTTLSQP
jgi:hypothetical protein